MDQEQLTQYLVALQFCSRIFQSSPDEDMLRGVVGGGLLQGLGSWECFRPSKQAEKIWGGAHAPETSAAALGAAYPAEAAQDSCRSMYLDLHMDHLALFSGPQPLAAPWESVWREKDRLLFGHSTQEVRDCYREWGIAAERDGHEPEDHLGLELAFVLFLVQNLGSGAVSCRGESPQAALAAFIDGHIMVWAGECLKKASECASTVFYREMSALCCLLLGNIRRHIAGVPA
jgi:TorA maturation chaperone TorD